VISAGQPATESGLDGGNHCIGGYMVYICGEGVGEGRRGDGREQRQRKFMVVA